MGWQYPLKSPPVQREMQIWHLREVGRKSQQTEEIGNSWKGTVIKVLEEGGIQGERGLDVGKNGEALGIPGWGWRTAPGLLCQVCDLTSLAMNQLTLQSCHSMLSNKSPLGSLSANKAGGA